MSNSLAKFKIYLWNSYGRFYDWYEFSHARRQYAKNCFTEKQINTTPLSDAQKQEIISFWKPYYNIKKELHWFEFYNTYCEDKQLLKYYIPDSIYYSIIDAFYTHPKRSLDIDDKNFYDFYFYDIKRPNTILHKANGFLLDKDYQRITIEQAVDLCKNFKSVISKKTINSEAGEGVRFFDFDSISDKELFEWLKQEDYFIIQEVVQQHPSLSKIYDKSINTVRIVSFMLDDGLHLLSSDFRMGRNGSRVDNLNSGGIVCGIDESGCLKEFACDSAGNRYAQHPQGTTFKGYPIVGYSKCCDLVKELAGRLVGVSQLLSWDFAIGPDGEPILIEVNLTYGGVDHHQINNGPIFGELTEKVLKQVFRSPKP